MDIFTNRDTKFLFSSIAAFLAGFLLLSQLGIWVLRDNCMLFIAILSVIAGSGIAAVCFRYFYKQHELIGGAVSSIDNYLKGDTNARIESNPKIFTSPFVRFNIFNMSLIVVVFPEPFGPISPIIYPLGKVKVMSCNRKPSKDFDRFLTSK